MKVRFELYRGREEFTEDALAEAIEKNLQFVHELCESDEIEGAISIDGQLVIDDLSSAVQRLCFECVPILCEPGAAYGYTYFTAAARLDLTSTEATVAISGDYLANAEYPRRDLLRSLYECGIRYLAFIERLGAMGWSGAEGELAHLRRFANEAHAALATLK